MARTALRILETEQKKPADKRIHLVNIFNIEFERVTGRKNPLLWGGCMKAMTHFRYVDEETGETFTEYPDVSDWTEQVVGFFKDDFARNQRGFHFPYFIKQYGSFARFTPRKPGAKPTETIVLIRCSDCQTEHESDKLCPKCYGDKLIGSKEDALKAIASLGNSMNANKGE